MSVYIFTKTKGVVTSLVGVSTLLFTQTIFSLLELPLSSGGVVVAQLLALLAISFGMSTFFLTKLKSFTHKDCLINVITDSISLVILIHAYLSGVMGANGLALAMFYVFSASGFYYCFRQLSKSHL